jgi:hypothetical protein
VGSAVYTRRLALASLAVAAMLACLLTLDVGRASATTTLGCAGNVSHPFLRWLDPASYTLAPGGAFEGTISGWKVSGGTSVVVGNEPFKVHGATDARSLSIPAGGSATSAPFCVGLGYPTIRFFATGGGLLSPLKVEVIYTTALGTLTHPIGLIPVQRSWSPTPQQLLLANFTGLLSLDGLTSTVQLRFTPVGGAGWKIDDLYVDPWKVT